MNPFNSSAVSKAEMVPVPAPSDGVEVVADEALFSGMLADVLVAALGDQSGGEKENAPDHKKNNATGEPVQNPMVIPMAPPELASVSPPVSDAGLETWCASVMLSDNAGAQSLTWMNGEEAMKRQWTETTTSLSENKRSVSAPESRPDVQDLRTGSPVATVSDEASTEENNPLQIVQSPFSARNGCG